MVYCPYTDREISEAQSSREHIFPLSLGGVDGLEIPVDRAFNSGVGSKLDGALTKEFLFALKRTKFDARGHSGKKPVARIRSATYGEDNRPAQVDFHSEDGLRVWDSRDREVKERVPRFNISVSIDIDLPIRFAAKVALASGYFAYGDLFREHVDHQQFRDVMNTDLRNLDLTKAAADLGLGHLTLRVDSYLREVPNEPAHDVLNSMRAYCSSVEGSVVVLAPGYDCFSVAVGVLGQYVATVIAPAETDSFPNDGDYAWGHVLTVDGRTLRRCSWVDALSQWVGIADRDSDKAEGGKRRIQRRGGRDNRRRVSMRPNHNSDRTTRFSLNTMTSHQKRPQVLELVPSPVRKRVPLLADALCQALD